MGWAHEKTFLASLDASSCRYPARCDIPRARTAAACSLRDDKPRRGSGTRYAQPWLTSPRPKNFAEMAMSPDIRFSASESWMLS